MRIRPAITLLGGLGLSAAMLSGCSTSALDTAKLQDAVTTGLAEQVGGAWTVTCPADQPIKKGATFTCDAVSTDDGTTVTILVTQDDEEGNVTWETGEATAGASPAASPAAE